MSGVEIDRGKDAAMAIGPRGILRDVLVYRG